MRRVETHRPRALLVAATIIWLMGAIDAASWLVSLQPNEIRITLGWLGLIAGPALLAGHRVWWKVCLVVLGLQALGLTLFSRPVDSVLGFRAEHWIRGTSLVALGLLLTRPVKSYVRSGRHVRVSRRPEWRWRMWLVRGGSASIAISTLILVIGIGLQHRETRHAIDAVQSHFDEGRPSGVSHGRGVLTDLRRLLWTSRGRAALRRIDAEHDDLFYDEVQDRVIVLSPVEPCRVNGEVVDYGTTNATIVRPRFDAPHGWMEGVGVEMRLHIESVDRFDQGVAFVVRTRDARISNIPAINDSWVEPDERHLMLLDEVEAYWRTMGEADWPRLIALP